jgi:hypothetical protein
MEERPECSHRHLPERRIFILWARGIPPKWARSPRRVKRSGPEAGRVLHVEGNFPVELDKLSQTIEAVRAKRPRSNLAVTGIYQYGQQVFSILESLRPSARGGLEITDVNSELLRRGLLSYVDLRNPWFDAGTVEALYAAQRLVCSYTRQNGDETVTWSGKVVDHPRRVAGRRGQTTRTSNSLATRRMRG